MKSEITHSQIKHKSLENCFEVLGLCVQLH